jgi:hypothetical protein
MVVHLRDLTAMTVPRLRKLARAYGVPSLGALLISCFCNGFFLRSADCAGLKKSVVVKSLRKLVKRDAKASAYLERAKTYWRYARPCNGFSGSLTSLLAVWRSLGSSP